MAATSIGVKVIGIRPLQKKLEAFRLASKFAGDEGTREAAFAVAQEAKKRAPSLKDMTQAWSKDVSPRFLKESIVVTRAGGPGTTVFIVGSTAPYAYYVEFGVEHPGVSDGVVKFYSSKLKRWVWIDCSQYPIRAHKIKAQPFFRKAVLWGEKKHYLSVARHWTNKARRFVV